ncbi:MAG: cytochrome c family protein [Acetobacteraceae bacterium]|jgi:cytochrome c
MSAALFGGFSPPALIWINAIGSPGDTLRERLPRSTTMRARPLCVPLLASAVFLMLANAAPQQAQAADPAAGEAVFRSQCGICHSPKPDRNMIGPTLFGVVGRTTGSVPGYAFSVSNKNSNITWTPEVLDKYLDSPKVVIPGTKMPYAGLKDPTKRADLIAYLETLK